MKLTPAHHLLAMHSPKSWARVIRKRNKALLALLKQLIPYAGGDIPEEVRNAVSTRVPIGCPHCLIGKANCTRPCSTCLYYTVLGVCCMELRFHRCNLTEVPLVNYAPGFARLIIPPALSRDTLQMAIDFVEAHILWTQDPDWGKETKS